MAVVSLLVQFYSFIHSFVCLYMYALLIENVYLMFACINRVAIAANESEKVSDGRLGDYQLRGGEQGRLPRRPH